MKRLIFIVTLAFLFTSCDSVLSPESGTTDPDSPPSDSSKQAHQHEWTIQESGTQSELDDVFFLNPRKGWIAANDTLLYTSDGGATWEQRQLPESGLTSVHFVDSLTGWGVGSQTIQHTTDGGRTWQPQGSETVSEAFGEGGQSLRDLHFVSADTGWAIGSDISEEHSTIFRTTNGGQTWQVQYEYNEELKRGDLAKGLRAVHFANDREGWAVGAAQVTPGPGGSPPSDQPWLLHTTDGGQTWNEQTGDVIDGWSLWDVQFTDPDTGWMIGRAPSIEDGFADQPVSRTTDGGENWTGEPLGDVNAFHFANDQDGWTVGWEIRHTDDGGQTWETQDNPAGERDRLTDVFFADKHNGWAVGRNGTIVHYHCINQ